MQGIRDDGLPLKYDAKAIESFWSEHPVIVARRAWQVLTAVAPFACRTTLQYHWGTLSKEHPEAQAAAAIELRQLLTRLGPTAIKFGQAMSIRPDLLPSVVIYELQKLCDQVPGYATADALRIIGDEMGCDPTRVFEGLDREAQPIAAASLGQVYKVKLRSPNVTVAVKVQRPDMVRAVSLDLHLLRRYAQCVEAVKGVATWAGVMAQRKQFDLQLVETFAAASYSELDYVNEGRNQERFSAELVPAMKGAVRVPRVFWKASSTEGTECQCTTRKVLVTEWIEGQQLAKCSPQTINRLVPTGVACFLSQLLDLGFFHSDPHPGNILVDSDGRLCLIDFGLCAEVSAPDTQTMTSALVHLMHADLPALLDDAVALGFLPDSVDRRALLSDLSRIFEESRLAVENPLDLGLPAAPAPSPRFWGRWFRGASGTPSANEPTEASGYRATQRRRKQFKAVSRDLNSVFLEYPFQVPDYFALVTRALIVLEGIAVVGDPAFDIFRAAYPFALKKALTLFGPEVMYKVTGGSGRKLSG